MQDNNLHKGPQEGLASTHVPITVSTAFPNIATRHASSEKTSGCVHRSQIYTYNSGTHEHIYTNLVNTHYNPLNKNKITAILLNMAHIFSPFTLTWNCNESLLLLSLRSPTVKLKISPKTIIVI